MIKIGIIGSEGFIGRHLVKVFDDKSKFETHCFGREQNSKFNHSNYSKINLLDTRTNKAKFKSFDLIYYLASSTIPATSYNNSLSDVSKNLIPFLSFLEAIKNTKIKKIVFTSSGGTVYGGSKYQLREDSTKKPIIPHGIIKLTMEYYLEYFRINYDLNYSVFRISNIYGEYQDTSKGLGLINTTLEKIIEKKQPVIFGDGSSVRNYIYVKDVVRALMLSSESDFEKSEEYNLASHDTLSINEILNIINNTSSESFKVEYISSRKSDLEIVEISNKKFLKHYPKFKFTALKEGIQSTYTFLKLHNN